MPGYRGDVASEEFDFPPRGEQRAERFLRAIEEGVASHGAALMAILNVTPDSFSDGGRYLERESAIARARELVVAGANLVDIGAESTRPGAPVVPAAEQLRRTLPIVEALAGEVAITVDTTNAEVARTCLMAGAVAVNDVSCAGNARLGMAAAEMGAGYILSHARQGQSEMTNFGAWPEEDYADVVMDVRAELLTARERLEKLGIRKEAIILDPGLGFTKSSLHSARLLAHVDELVQEGPVLIGSSRKSFLTLAVGSVPPTERLGASVAAALWAARRGARIVRVHDVVETSQALRTERWLARASADA